LGLDRWRVES
jgi:hypothetical protein